MEHSFFFLRRIASPGGLVGTASRRFMRASPTLFAASAGSGSNFDPYRILGVPPSATPQDIKKAFHRLALKYHPDQPGTGDAERFRAVHEAYQTVKDGQTWSPGAGPGGSGADGGGGGEASARSRASEFYRGGFYSYEPPGSTTENYFASNRRQQTFAKLVLVWCAGLVVLRVVLLAIFPLRGQAHRMAAHDGPDDDTAQARQGSPPVQRGTMLQAGPLPVGFAAPPQQQSQPVSSEPRTDASSPAWMGRGWGGQPPQVVSGEMNSAGPNEPSSTAAGGNVYRF